MSYDYSGSIKIIDKGGYPEAEQLLKDAASKLLKEDECYEGEDYPELTELLESFYKDSTSFCDEGDFDDVESWNYLMKNICKMLIFTCPSCKFNAYYFGISDSTGNTWGMKQEYRNGKIIGLECENAETWNVSCPECEESVVEYAELEFNKSYECYECEHVLEARDILEDLITKQILYLKNINEDGTEKDCLYWNSENLIDTILSL